MRFDKIIFLYPSRNIGGVQLLFYRLAIELTKNYSSISVYYIDYQDGFIANKIYQEDTSIELIKYDESPLDGIENAYVILPLSLLGGVDNYFLHDNGLLDFRFWSLQPTNLKANYQVSHRKIFAKKEKFLEKASFIQKAGNIFFMDNSNLDGYKSEFPKNFTVKNPVIIPIGVGFRENSYIPDTDISVINIAWLGRLSYEKYNSVLKIAEEISASSIPINYRFHIIGSGAYCDKLQFRLKKLTIETIYTGDIIDKELYNYLSRMDIGISMGTSALEFASVGVPVALVDIFPKPIKFVKYNWIHETRGFSLGCIWASDTINNRMHTFDELIESCIRNPIKQSELSYQYAVSMHSFKVVSSKLIKYLKKDLKIISFEYLLDAGYCSRTKYYRYLCEKYKLLRGYFSA
jgi:hypothetical protein